MSALFSAFRRHREIPTTAEDPKPMSEAEINAALAIPKDAPIWRALHQLIRTAEANANDNAAIHIHEPGTLEGYVGAAKHFRMLKQELTNRRELGLQDAGQQRLKTEQRIRGK